MFKVELIFCSRSHKTRLTTVAKGTQGYSSHEIIYAWSVFRGMFVKSHGQRNLAKKNLNGNKSWRSERYCIWKLNIDLSGDTKYWENR